jgi:hypothetical protein
MRHNMLCTKNSLVVLGGSVKQVKLAALVAVVVAFLSAAAMADNGGSTFGNFGGTMTEFAQDHTGYYLSVPSSSLTGVSGIQGFNCGFGSSNTCHGTVNFKSGLTNGLNQSLINNIGYTGEQTVLGAGGAFDIHQTVSGYGSLTFTGTFTSDTWTFVGNASQGIYQWVLAGSVSGTLTLKNSQGIVIYTAPFTGATVQLTTSKMFTDPFANPGGSIKLNGGTTGFPMGVVPESSTLFLFGTGLMGIVLMAKRRFLPGLRT